MEIRKKFKYEMGHIVRNAWSTRCSRNAHGHSYEVEFNFTGNGADNGQMLVDFGFIKQYLHPFVDGFDHSFWLWDRPEDKHIIDFFNKEFERVLVSPWSTTAEMQAKMFFTYADKLIDYLKQNNLFENNESIGWLQCSSVRVHETTTGWAEYSAKDVNFDKFPETNLDHLYISDGVMSEWPKGFEDMYHKVIKYNKYKQDVLV